MPRTKPWKQNLLSIPPQLKAKVESFASNDCVAACAVRINSEKIRSGLFHHLGIYWRDDGLVYPDQIVPDSSIGRYSSYNRFGREIIRDDLPLTSRTWSIETPNYGDWGKGSHSIDFSRDVYQREFFAPKLLPIQIEHRGEDVRNQAQVFQFTVPEVLDRTSDDFWEQLLFNLNLLQENTGNHGVFESDASLEDYLKTLYVNWVILPPGEADKVLTQILEHTKSDDPRTKQQIVERHRFLQSLKPESYIAGVNEFRRYFGAKFAEDLVVFENLEYGNAIYVMFEDWQALSQKPRTELLSTAVGQFVRIPHTKSWKRRLARLIRSERVKRSVSRTAGKQS